jgi:L,D-peptidoglycan transpeptidase YkuD (ErfK/YbiS/YcfS/YnhG family)
MAISPLAIGIALGVPNAAAAPSIGCTPNLANRLTTTEGASQVITVVASTSQSTFATVQLWQMQGKCFRSVAGPFTGRVGYNGLSAKHHEGDGTTPMGNYGFESTMYGLLSSPGVHYPYTRVTCGDWWDEDPRSSEYNRFVTIGCGAHPTFGGGSEALWKTIPAYDSFAVIAYNTNPVVPGRGSAIFLHLGTKTPTNGCVSLGQSSLLSTLRWLNPAKNPRIVIGTAQTITNY